MIDRGEQDGKEFIVFELVEGENLKELVERGGPLPVRRALELGLQVGRALAFAHGEGIVHRDVKPQNVLLDGEGRAKVTDFGIARTIDAVGTTETGTVLGTSHYIAPEQARGEKVDAQTDVYSFGVVLWELLAGEVPYAGENFLTVAMRHVNDPVPNVLDRRPDTPLRLATLIESCMAKEPADRPASMEDVVEELQACLARARREGRRRGDDDRAAGPSSARGVRGPRARRDRRALLLPLARRSPPGGRRRRAPAHARRRRDGAAPARPAVRLAGIGAFDPPPGDGEEHSDEAPLATDGNASTFWRTESYRAALEAIGKSGVGLVLDAGAAKKIGEVTVTTDTPGFTAEIKAGGSPEGPFETVGESKTRRGRHDVGARRRRRALLRRLDHRARRQRARQRGEGLLDVLGPRVENARMEAAERKLATVLFADLVGSTALGEQQDPERTRVVLERFYDAMAEEIEPGRRDGREVRRRRRHGGLRRAGGARGPRRARAARRARDAAPARGALRRSS